ncbi:MAG: guanylate kinase [Bacteroidota bacterium]|nr:guanylate kinase [Bacteroidota bacterium]
MSDNNFTGKAIIFSAPSGAGKTTIVKSLLANKLPLSFSISACSRQKRENEINGKDYHFLSIEDFKQKINEQAFIEWEEVYENNYYGTLKSEIERIWNDKKHVVFDVDVVGGLNLKKHFGNNALAIFIQPPSMDVLIERLRNRATESEASLNKRINKAKHEMTYSPSFDSIIINDQLEKTIEVAEKKVKDFLNL